MFKGEKKKSKQEDPDQLNRLVLGTSLSGDLSTNSSLRIDGRIDGNVVCKGKIVLGKEGIIAGNIQAVEMELDGTVEGNINAELLLTLHSSAVVRGDIQTSRLVIEDGARVGGNIQTGDMSKKTIDTGSKTKSNLTEKEALQSTKSKAPDIVY